MFDLDGTLTKSKSPMTPDMGEALARLIARVPVAVTSGGWFPQYEKQFLPYLPENFVRENLYLFPSSASRCYLYRDGAWTVRYAHDFTPAERDEIMAALKASLEEAGLGEDPTPVWGPRIEDRGSQITFSALGQRAPVEEKAKWDPDKTKRTPVRDGVARRVPGLSVRMNSYSSIDITKEGLDKAYGVRQYSELTGIPIGEMLYVGDGLFPGGNDEVVVATGIPTHKVSGPDESKALIEKMVSSF